MVQYINRVELTTMEETVIAALAKYAAKATFAIGSAPLSSKELQTQLQAHVDASNAAYESRVTHSRLVAAARARREQTAPLLAAVRAYAAVTFGEQSAEFTAFGFKPRKVAQRTAESKAGAVEKLRATRVARHTMGKRQRAAIHGTVPTSSPASGPGASPPATGAPVTGSPVTTALPVNPGANGAAAPHVNANGVTH